MINEECLKKLEEDNKKLEADNEKLLKLLDLRDKLLHLVLKETYPEILCGSCAFKDICANGAKVEVCTAGMLLALDTSQKAIEASEK